MKQLLLGGVSLGLHLYFFVAFGSLFLKLRKKEETFSWCFTPVLGLFIYYGLFELLAFPMTLLLAPLHLLTISWGVILAIVGVAAVFFCGSMWGKSLKKLWSVLMKHKGVFLVLLLLVAVQLVYEAVYGLNSPDAAFYVGNVSTSLYTDTMGRYSAYTGKALSRFNIRYVTAAYYLDNAAYCQALGLHPMVQMKTIAPVMNLFMANLIYYHMGMLLFHGNRKKAAAFGCAVLFFGILAGNMTYSGFTYYRSFEGKAMLCGMIIPFLLTAFLKLYGNHKDEMAWWSIFFVSLGGVCLTTSSMTLVPAAVAAGGLTLMLTKKNWKLIPRAILCVLPDILVLCLYMAVKLDWITLSAK